jgi:ATPase subunit of ABC transporter with duplicated ATPase domains
MSVIGRFSDLTVDFNDHRLFHDLAASLEEGVTALVGPNGRGKSVLLKLLAGELAPTTGDIQWHRPHYRVDQLQRLPAGRVADALGVTHLHDTFARIARGDAEPADLDRVAALWHLPAQWQQQLADAGLNTDMERAVDTLSGGEQSRLALCAAFLRRNHYLLLDEPSNHMDAAGRRWLLERLKAHPGGALVASHDRTLLRGADAVLELRADGLRRHGSYEALQNWREREAAALEQRIDDAEKQRRRLREERQAAAERAARRRRQGEKQRRSGSQSKMLLDKGAERAENRGGRNRIAHAQREARVAAQLQRDRAQREALPTQRLPLAGDGHGAAVRLHLEAVTLPGSAHAPLSLTLRAGERWRVHGPNGCGKTTLLRIMAGRLAPESGNCRRHGSCVYLDQDFRLLDPASSAVDNLRRLHPEAADADWRTRLAGLRLPGDEALLPLAALSGGERLKVALLAVTGGAEPPATLLLDEPDNHLDLDSRELLEAALQNYSGTLVVVSHDEDFVARIGVTHTLTL